MDEFVISDYHGFHGNIIKYCHRPFLCKKDQEELDRRDGKWHNGPWKDGKDTYKIDWESIKLMNETMINETNKIVKRNDKLWFLGDFVFGKGNQYYKNAEWFRKSINCENVYIVWGNHDRRTIKYLFSDVFDQVMINVYNCNVVLNHYALAIWEKSHRRSLHAYGHSHSEAEEWLDRLMPNRRSMDVGIDNVYKLYGKFRPLHFKEFIERLAKKDGDHPQEHLKEAYKQPEEEHVL